MNVRLSTIRQCMHLQSREFQETSAGLSMAVRDEILAGNFPPRERYIPRHQREDDYDTAFSLHIDNRK